MSKFTPQYLHNLYGKKTENLNETCELIFEKIDEELDSFFNSEILKLYEKKYLTHNFKINFDEKIILDSVSTLGSSFYEKEIEKKLKTYENDVLKLTLKSLTLDENIRNEDFLELDFELKAEVPKIRTNKNI